MLPPAKVFHGAVQWHSNSSMIQRWPNLGDDSFFRQLDYVSVQSSSWRLYCNEQ